MYVKALKEGFQRYNWLSTYQKWRRLDNDDTVGVAFTRGLKQREMFISGTDSKGNVHQWDRHKCLSREKACSVKRIWLSLIIRNIK